MAHTNPTVYYRRAEDFKVELVPDTESTDETGINSIDVLAEYHHANGVRRNGNFVDTGVEDNAIWAMYLMARHSTKWAETSEHGDNANGHKRFRTNLCVARLTSPTAKCKEATPIQFVRCQSCAGNGCQQKEE
eukprot:6491834-Amphidinium_carterae.7